MVTLNPKQRIFAQVFAETGSREKARVAAGISMATAARYKNNPDVMAYIDELMQSITSERIANIEEIMEYLTKVMRGETIEEVVIVESDGDGFSKARIIEKHPCEKDRLKAAELLGKRYAMWTDKTQIEGGPIPVIINGENELED